MACERKGFTDGINKEEQTDFLQKQEEATQIKEETTLADLERQEVQSPSEVDPSPFLEHLLEVDQIENGHSISSSREADSPRGCTFVSCRNYLSERGINQTPRGPHEQKKFVICGPLPKGYASTYFRSRPNSNVASSRVISNGRTSVDSRLELPVSYSKHLPKNRAHNMSYIDSNMSQNMRLSEKEELQRLNDRLTLYVNRVRMLSDQGSQLDSTAFLKSAKILEEEINNLKNIYEQELDKLRKDIEVLSHEKNTLQIQSNKHQQESSEIQDRLSVEKDKNHKLMEEYAALQRHITNLESQLHSMKMSAVMKPTDSTEHLQRMVDTLTREKETMKHRYDAEQVARQEAEDKIQQLMKKLDFNEQVNAQQVAELRNRMETSVATILSLEAKVRDLSKSDSSVGELLKSVREASEAELRKFKMESESEYNRNISAMKTQLDNDAGTIDRLRTERSQQDGQIVELKARVRSLEGQLSNIEHQRKSLEQALALERSKAAESVQSLEKKLREVQDLLVVKMKEVTPNIPLKTEIESLKILLEEEERRLKTPPVIPSTQAATMLPPTDRSFTPTNYPPTSYPSTSYPATTYPSTTYPSTTYPTTMSPPVYGNYSSAMAGTTSYVPVPPLPMTLTSGVSARGLDYTTPFGTTSPYEQDFTTTYIPPYIENTEPITGIDFPLSTANYMYDTSPSVNRLQVEPTPPETPRDPPSSQRMMQRAKSAPVSGPRNVPLVPTSLGQGKDYFDEMFKDLQRDTLYSSLRPKSSPVERPTSSTYHDYTVSTSSAIGDVKIMEVNQEGKFVRLLNDGAQELEFGGYMLQQNVGGHPVAVYRFPPRTKFPPNSTITVWSGMNDPILHQPPSDFVWKEQQKWGTGPECTSILCRPNGQAIAWTTAAHRFTRNAFEEEKEEEQLQPLDLAPADDKDGSISGQDEILTECNVDATNKQEHVYLRREKQSPPSLGAQRHPHGTSPSQNVHPHTGQARPLMYGNDNSTVNRQSRQQSTRPDPIPGQPYAGAAAQKMGSAPLRKYISQSASVRGNGSLANRSVSGSTTSPPSPFMKPRSRFQQGLTQVQSQHNQYLPPMPRPPLVAEW